MTSVEKSSDVGAMGWDRTSGLRRMKAMLYQLSYQGIWRSKQDLNLQSEFPRTPAFQVGRLPIIALLQSLCPFLLYAVFRHCIFIETMATRVGVEPTSLQGRLPVFGTGRHSHLPSSPYWRRAWDLNPNTQHKPGYYPISNRGPYHLGLPLHILITNSIASLSPSGAPDALNNPAIFKKG